MKIDTNMLEMNKVKIDELSFIAIVDDDEDDRELIIDAMLENGIGSEKLRTAVDGVDLMELLSKNGSLPSIIILDLNMPRMGGREVLTAIRANTTLKHIPVIVFSTSDADIDVKECYDLGCNTYMTKPNDYTSLIEAVQVILLYWTSNSTLLTSH